MPIPQYDNEARHSEGLQKFTHLTLFKAHLNLHTSSINSHLHQNATTTASIKTMTFRLVVEHPNRRTTRAALQMIFFSRMNAS